MFAKLKALKSLKESMGLKWILFRAAYSFRKTSGLLKIQIPSFTWDKFQIADRISPSVPHSEKEYAIWKKNAVFSLFPINNIQYPDAIPWDKNESIQSSLRFLEGQVRYFSYMYQTLGFPPDWLKDPFSEIKYDTGNHWSQIADYGDSDIKFVWEVNRFGWVFGLVRAYAAEQDDMFPQAFWTCIEDWMEKNPPGMGPNWKDGQEVSLRMMAACFGYFAFLHSDSTTDQRISRFTLFIAAHAQRIFQNLDFAISTRSNHTISEGFGLWLTGLLFPELMQAEKYKTIGCNILEKEVTNQFLADGGYAMYSLNYQRFVLHIYLLAIRLGERTRNPFSDLLRQTFAKSVDMIYQLMDKNSGQLSFFGSNDGALILPLNNCDYSDFRPLVQAGYYLIHEKRLFDPGPWDEDLFWFFGSEALTAKKEENPPAKRNRFPDSGMFRIDSKNSYATVRCVDFQSRPSHADQLHVDFWWYGKNIACDAGTYLYNGNDPWQNGLSGTDVHNTVSVDDQDQMQRLSRITWGDWAKGKVEFEQTKNGIQIWKGSHDGYRRLKDPIDHCRKVITLGENRWLIVDQLIGSAVHHYRLHWLLEDGPYQLLPQSNGIIYASMEQPCKIQVGSTNDRSKFSLQKADPGSTRGWRSRFYGQKEPALSMVLVCGSAENYFLDIFWLPAG